MDEIDEDEIKIMEFLKAAISEIKHPLVKQCLEERMQNNPADLVDELSDILMEFDNLTPEGALDLLGRSYAATKAVDAYCAQQEALRPPLEQKTAQLRDLIENFDQPNRGDIAKYKDLKIIAELVKDEEVDATATTFHLGNFLHSAIVHLGETDFVNSSRSARATYLSILSTLIRRGADVNQQGADGSSPVLLADWQADVVKLLHENGADITAKFYSEILDKHFGLAADDDHPTLATYNLMQLDDHTSERLEVLNYLLENGLDPDQEDDAQCRMELHMLKDPLYFFSIGEEELTETIADLDPLFIVLGGALKNEYKRQKARGVSQAAYTNYIDDYLNEVVDTIVVAYDINASPLDIKRLKKQLKSFGQTMVFGDEY